MALDKEQAQGIIDDFVFSNDKELGNIATQNKALFDATINALDFLSKRFGTAQEIAKDRVLNMVKVKDELPFKVGDKFIDTDGKSNITYTILEIDPTKNNFEFEGNGLKINGFTLDDAKKTFEKGGWKLIEDLPFKVGDKFYIQIRGKDNIYIISSITNDIVKVKNIENNVTDYDYSIGEVIKSFENGFWIKIEDDSQFKVDDYLYAPHENNEIYKIVDVNKDIDVGVVSIKNTNSNPIYFSIDDAKHFINVGDWVLLGDFPFKVGDVYLVTINSGDTTLTILDADFRDVKVKYADGSIGMFFLNDAISRVVRGTWKKVVNDLPFKVGQIIYDKEIDELIEIVDVTVSGITYKDSEGFKGFKDNVVFEKQLKEGIYKFLSFKIDDIFEDEDGDKIKIEKLNKRVGFIDIIQNYTSNVMRDWESIEDSIKDGKWVLFDNKNKVEIKVGQIFINIKENNLFELKNIDNEFVKLESYIFKNSIKIEEFKKQIGYDYILVNFKIGDNFTDGTDTIKIERLNPNDGIGVIVSINGKHESMYWGDINNEIQSGSWKPITQTPQAPVFKFNIGDTFEVVSNKSTWTIVDIVKDFDEYIIKNDDNPTTTPINRKLLEDDVEFKRLVQIFVNQPLTTSNLTQAKPNKTQQKMAKVTATPSKIAKKTLSKEEKAIKMLQKEIDGLELIASFNDEAKEELEKKLIEIKALKSKIS